MIRWKNAPYIVLTFTVAIVMALFVYSTVSEDGRIELDTVKYIKSESGVEGSAYIFTSCALIEKPAGGVSVPEYLDSQLVDKGAVVAKAYEGDRESLELIKENGEKIYVFKASDTDNEGLTLKSLDEKISRITAEIHRATENGDIGCTVEKQRQLYILLNKREILTNKIDGYGKQTELLGEKIKSIAVVSALKVTDVVSPEKGYFFSQCNGAESIFNASVIDTLTAESFDRLTEQAGDNGEYAGKILTDTKWFFAFKADNSKASEFAVGKTYNAQLDDGITFDAVLHKAVYGENDCLLIFSCNVLDSDFVFPVKCAVKVISEGLNGIAVPKNAVYYKDGTSGVYAVKNNVLKFIPVSFTEADDSHYFVQSSDGELELYDRVAVSGKDIHDGKIIG